MILLLGGTTEGRQLAEKLLQKGFKLLVCTATSYGGSLLPQGTTGIDIVSRRLNNIELAEMIGSADVLAVVDATHPHAKKITAIASSAAQKYQKPYYRWERSSSRIPWEAPLVHGVDHWSDAARVAAALGNTIFLTTGSGWLPAFTSHQALRDKRLIARVLAVPESVQACLDYGIPVKDIIALQGPCSQELNKALYRQYGADVVVTKDSGLTGGTEEKVRAALELDLPVVIIRRPPEAGATQVSDYEQLYQLLKGDK